MKTISVIYLYVFVGLFTILLSQNLQAQVTTWSVPTLKDYVDQRFDSMQEAVNKAEVATEKRFESVNEFRLTLSDQQKSFADQQRNYLSRTEYEAAHSSLVREVTDLKDRLNKYENERAGGTNTIAYIAAAIGLLIGLIALGRNFFGGVLKK